MEYLHSTFGNDVTQLICRQIHHIYLIKVNKEYHRRTCISTFDASVLFQSSLSQDWKLPYNYRKLKNKNDHYYDAVHKTIYNKHGHDVAALPSKYW